MKYAFNFGKIEVTGICEIQDVNIQAEADVEETVTMLKQILPIVKEIKSLNMFQTEKDNKGLCEKLNLARDEKRDVERERDQAKAKEEYFVKKFNELEDSTNDEIRELKEKLMVAEARLSQPQPVPQSKK